MRADVRNALIAAAVGIGMIVVFLWGSPIAPPLSSDQARENRINAMAERLREAHEAVRRAHEPRP